MPKREPPSWETVLKRNTVERLKHELFPTELTGQWQRLVDMPYDKLPEEDIVRLQWFGMYHDKPKIGTFMMRIKIPGGRLSPEGLRAVGEISEQYGRNQGELTTRQNFQLHYMTLDHFPEIFERLKRAGLTTMGGCGDVVRNITGCPVAGVDRDESFDVTGILTGAAQFFYGNREYSDLPRKHKITIAACPYQCNAPEINCIALVGMIRDGREGFAVRVGGGQSSTPRLSRHLGVFVEPEQAITVLRAIIDVWQGTTEYRLSRVKARLKFMIDDYSVDIRLTRRQNFILTRIPEDRSAEVIARVGEIGFPLDANGLYSSSIGCIGDPHCGYAVTPTKTKLATIIERLVGEFGDAVAGLKLNLDGCPHACAHHWTG